MPNTLALKIPGTTLPGNWPKIYADASIDESSIYCYDVVDPLCWPSQAAATLPASLINLVTGTADAAFQAPPTGGPWPGQPFESKGFKLDLNNGYHLKLPDAAKLPANTDNFLAVLWIYMGVQTQANWSLFGWGDTAPFEVRSDAGAISMRMGGVIQPISISTNAVHQICVAREKKADGTFLFHKLIDGVPVATVAGPAALYQPTNPSTNAAIGDVPGSTQPGYFIGRWSRSYLTTKARTTAQIQDWVAADWVANLARLTP